MKNKKIAPFVAILIIGILMVSVGVIGMNYRKINRLIDNIADKTQSSGNNVGIASDIEGESEKKLSKDEKKISKLVDKYMEAIISCDVSAIIHMYPEEVINLMEKYISLMYEDQDECFSERNEEMANNWDELQESLGTAEYKITYEISDFIDMTKEEIADYQSEYSIYTMFDDTLDELNIEITEAKTVIVDIYVNYDDTTDKAGYLTPTFIKVDGKWYLGIDQ